MCESSHRSFSRHVDGLASSQSSQQKESHDYSSNLVSQF